VPIRHIIFSGGEPTIHPLHIVRNALGADWTAEVETNGTRVPHLEFSDFSQEIYSRFQWNVSPKGSAAEETISTEALEHWGALAQFQENVFLKCVVREANKEDDLHEILGWQKRFGWPRSRVFLMPEGITRASQMNAVWLHDLCIDHNLRMAPRLHVKLFENKMGL
jgi:organic radical activating enzyme